MTSIEALARQAYYEYAMAMSTTPKPHWYDLSLQEKNAWLAAVKAVQASLQAVL
jgi:hypothetical protein